MLIGGTDGVSIAAATAAVVVGAVALASQIGGAIFGASSARKAKRKQQARIAEAKKENEAWYKRNYNEDATQRADWQNMMRVTNDALERRARGAAGKRAVIGGTDATLAAEQQANAAAMGNVIADAAVRNESRKDEIQQSYRTRQQSLEDQAANVQAQYDAQKGQNTAQAIQGIGSAAASIIGAAGSGKSGGASTASAGGATSGISAAQTVNNNMSQQNLFSSRLLSNSGGDVYGNFTKQYGKYYNLPTYKSAMTWFNQHKIR